MERSSRASHLAVRSTSRPGRYGSSRIATRVNTHAYVGRYKRYELASRYAWLYTSVAVAGALSGLLAGVITDYMDGAGGIRGWRWLFIIEGVGSVIIGIVVIFVMPDYPTSHGTFLSEEERTLACNRLAMDGMGLTQAAHAKVSEWVALKMTVKDWRTWSLCLLFMLGTGAQTMQYFLPSIVETLGWEGHEAQCKLVFHARQPLHRHCWISRRDAG